MTILDPVPPDGLLVWPYTFPYTFPAPWSAGLQALVGTTLTNCWVLEVEK